MTFGRKLMSQNWEIRKKAVHYIESFVDMYSNEDNSVELGEMDSTPVIQNPSGEFFSLDRIYLVNDMLYFDFSSESDECTIAMCSIYSDTLFEVADFLEEREEEVKELNSDEK